MLLLRLKSSRIELLFLLACHGMALFALSQSSVTFVLLCVIAALVVGNLLYCTGLLPVRQQRPQQIAIAAHQCVLEFPHRQLHTALPRIQFFSEWLIVLRFDELLHGSGQLRAKTPARVVVRLLPDSLDPDSDRLLRSYLRFQKRQA